MHRLQLKAGLKPQSLRGFSLIEIMVVVTLMAIFIGLGTVYFMGQLEKGRLQAAATQAKQFETALDLYKMDRGRYPSTSEGLDILMPKYMKDIPVDPWGREYNYALPGTHNPEGFDVWSDGPDGEGGDAAIGNWPMKKEEE